MNLMNWVAGLSLRQLVLLLVTALLAGCGEADGIRTYTIPKEQPPAPFAKSEGPTQGEPGEPVDRMLTVIVPESGRAWFYKVTGPIPLVTEHEQAILDFVQSVPPAAGGASPNWTLPTGWSSRPGTDGVTAALIRVPTGGQPLEISVSALPWAGTDEGLLQNVNRWRGQMGLPPTVAADLAKDVREVRSADRTFTVVDLQGVFRRGMMPPFAGGAARGGAAGGAARGSASGSRRGDVPPDHPPLGGGETSASGTGAAAGQDQPGAMPKFTAPAAWQQAAPGGMNRAIYRVSDGAAEGAVTVSNIPASSGAMFADPLQTANLWRQGVGMPPATPDEFASTSENLEIGGRPATFVSAIPPDDKPEATVAAMLRDGDQIWYFKFKGARQLVLDRQAEFKEFLKSVSFDE